MLDAIRHPLEARAAAAAAVLSALAHPKRLMILCLLSERALTAGELARRVGLSQSALSQHLARMRHLGILGARRDGQSIRYSLAAPIVGEIIAILCRHYCAQDCTQKPP
jgi:DNA-binding transcriptional ArsR family regulator